MLGALIGAATSLIGGSMQSKATDAANRAMAEQRQADRDMQMLFAQDGIKWRVNDAKQAGIHPLYALGANTVSYSPVGVGQIADTAPGAAMAAAGQDLSRAFNTTRSGPERDRAFTKTVQDMTITKMGLENEMLASQIAKLRQTPNPPLPIPETAPGKRPQLFGGGQQFNTDPGTSNVEDIQTRYGEPGEWFAAPYVLWRDFQHHYMDQLNKMHGGSSTRAMRSRFGEPPDWVKRLTGERR